MIHKEIQKKLEMIRVRPLDQREQDILWERVRFSMAKRTFRPKRTAGSFVRRSITVTLLFGMTAGTVFAADSARPGDMLFPVDRAFENIQISLVPSAKKDELKVKFALERVTEVKDILKEVAVLQTNTSIKASEQQAADAALSAKDPNQGEDPQTPTGTAAGDDGIGSSDPTTDSPETTDTAPIEVLSSEISSIGAEGVPALSSDLSQVDKKRIELALGTALSFLGEVKGELSKQGNDNGVRYVDLMLEQINEDISALPGSVTFEVQLSAKKTGVTFKVTSKEQERDQKPKVKIEVDGDETEEMASATNHDAKLEIKDGGMTMTTGTGTTTTDVATTTEEEIEQAPEAEKKEEKQEEEEPQKEETDEEHRVEIGTTTVKVIIEKLEEDFELSVPDDASAGLHDIIEKHLDANGPESR